MKNPQESNEPKAGGRQPPREDLFRVLVEAVQDYAIFMLDPTGHVLTWNNGAQRLKQYTEHEIVGTHFSVFYPEEDLAWGKPAFELKTATREGKFEDEGWRVRKDGSLFWANVVITALFDASGAISGFAKVTRDLTERKRSEEQLRQSETRLRLLVGSIRDYAVFMLDRDGVVATWNSGAEQIKGYRADEIVGRSFTTFYPESDVLAGKCAMELRVAEAEGRFEDEGWRIRKDGSRFWANVVISAVRDNDGKLIGFSKVTRDLTDRLRAEEERMARLAAEQTNRLKDEFLAMLGHELRNPLAPITHALHLIKLRAQAPISREYEIIERQVHHMIRLVDDLLDMARISRGRIELKMLAHDLREIVANAIETTSPLLTERRIQVHIQYPSAAVMVVADDDRLVQVFSNLFTNAAKYSDPGSPVFVSYAVANGEIEVKVRDEGLGIAADLLPRIFDLFVQAPQGLERSRGGLGIGLALVRRLVALHGGSVSAESAGPGRGTTFSVRLPQSPG